MRKRQRRWLAMSLLAAVIGFAVSTTASSTAAGPSSGTPTAAAAAAKRRSLQQIALERAGLKYVDQAGGRRGLNPAEAPVYVGLVNQQGGPIVIGADATLGAQLAVAYDEMPDSSVASTAIRSSLKTLFHRASAEEEERPAGSSSSPRRASQQSTREAWQIGIQSLYGDARRARSLTIARVRESPRSIPHRRTRSDPVRRRNARAGAVRHLRRECATRKDRGADLCQAEGPVSPPARWRSPAHSRRRNHSQGGRPRPAREPT